METINSYSANAVNYCKIIIWGKVNDHRLYLMIMENPCYIQSHVHLQTLTKTPAKFQEDPAKIVGEIAFT